MQNYTPEQIVDIEEREKKGLEALKALDLCPSALVSKVNVGKDTFVDRVQAYLRDTKYTPVPSTSPEVNPNA